MIRHPTTLSKIRLHCRSVATAPKPKAPDTVPYLYKWTPEPERPLRTPTPKVWSRPQQPIDSSSTLTPAEDPKREIFAVPPPESLKKWARPVAPLSNSKPSELSVLNSDSQSSIVPPAGRAALPPERLNKWSRPVALPFNRKPPEISILNSDSQPSIAPFAIQKNSRSKNDASQPTSLSPDSDHANSSPTLAKDPHKAIGAAPPPERLKKWSRPAALPSDIKLPEASVLRSDSQPPIAPLAPRKVSLPKNNASQPTSLSPDSHHANSSPALAETPVEHPSKAAPPKTLNKWSRPVASFSDSILPQTSVLNSEPRPSIAPLAAQKVSQPQNKPTSLSPNSEHANSSPTLIETPAEYPSIAISAAPPPERLKKWSRPVASPSNSILSQISALNSNTRPSMAPLPAQKVSPPSPLSPDSHSANSSRTLAETPAEHPSRAIRAASHEKLKRSQPLVPPSNSKLFEISVLRSDSQPSKAPPTTQRVLKPKSNASQRTSLIPDPDRTNQSLKETSQPQTSPRLEFNSLDTDPDDEFADKRLRSDAHRRNQKSYLEGRGRHERVSKSLLLQSANALLSQKKASTVPKLIKARRMDVFIPSTISVAALATLLNVKLARLQLQMKRAGMESESSYDHVLTSDYAILLAEEFGRNPIVDDEAAFDIHPPVVHPNPSSLPSRPPIVTIMGHVDHGKTTLLDTLRSASVAKGEAGGITQHIGAFSVPVNEKGSGPKSITFLDTPGHAAFSAMRARGANVTDIIVLVVAADDGIMPQTKEVINLFKRDDNQVSLVVAINKIDKPNVDLDSVKGALLAEGIQVEDFGGDIPAVNVSGLTGEGLPELLETLSLVAEMQDLRAEHTGSVYGHVLESNVQKGLGPVATILIRRGCLKAGAHVLSGLSHAKVRRMNDSNGKVVKAATPGMAVTVSGWKILPKAGDIVLDGSENDIKKAISNRERRQELEALHQDVDAINSRRQQHRDLRLSGEDEAPLEPVSSGPLELRLVIKADVSGSAEAVRDALHGMGNDIARAQVISAGVGDISESDVMMAKAAKATVVGFSVTASRSVQNIANQNGVPVCTSDIIYRLVDDIRERVTALLPVIVETKVTGEATILQLFDINLKQKQTMKIAGCRVTNGILEKQKFARVLRNGNIIFDGTLSTMRHIKKDITEARKGTECGLGFGEFRDLEAGDLIQMYEKIEKPGVL